MEFTYLGHSNSGGVYKLTNNSNGRVYIGSTFCFRVRWRQHESALRFGRHSNKFLQRDFDKCGTETFEFQILEVVVGSKSDRLQSESRWILKSLGPECYNFTADTQNSLLSFPDTAKEKLRAFRLGKKASPETRERLRESHLGKGTGPRKPHSDETKQKIRDKVRGLKPTPEAVANRTESIRKFYASLSDSEREKLFGSRGRKPTPQATIEKIKSTWETKMQKLKDAGIAYVSEERREHLRKLNTGKKRGPASEGTRAKLRAAWEKREKRSSGPMSEDVKAKIRTSNLGRKRSAETKAKLSAARKAYFARLKLLATDVVTEESNDGT